MELPDSEIHLYFCSPDEISGPALLRRYETLLTDDERTQMSRYYFARHRHQFLVTRVLIRTCLSSYFQVEPADWRFGKNAYGKPEIISPDGPWPLRFNLSHCNGLIMCGIARDHDIGVDVEDAQRSTSAAFDGLSTYFSAPEIAGLVQLPVNQQKERFFDYWTLKESYIKARGMGLAIPLDKFSFQFMGGHLTGFETHPDLQDDATNWQFWRIFMAERYRVAVAVNSGSTDFRINGFSVVPLQNTDSIQLDFS
jgi:4'-phosphopantetheinyl transferase